MESLMNADKFFGWFEASCDPRPLAAFRVIFYCGLALHFGPSLIWLEENYSATAFRTDQWNGWLYGIFDSLSSDVVLGFALLTGLALLAGALGIHARAAAIASAIGLYSFSSFNSLQVQTLALSSVFAILWLWAFLGTGDEVWALRRRKSPDSGLLTSAPAICRALIVAQVFMGLFFSGIEKVMANWPLSNEMHVLLSYPGGFMLRPWVAGLPIFENQYVGMALSVMTLIIELGVPVLFIFKKTRLPALLVYQAFFLGIVAMLQVPPLFYVIYAGCGVLVLSDEEVQRIWGPLDSKQ
jgi:hypothetical protein